MICCNVILLLAKNCKWNVVEQSTFCIAKFTCRLLPHRSLSGALLVNNVGFDTSLLCVLEEWLTGAYYQYYLIATGSDLIC